MSAPRSNDVATVLYQARRFEESLDQTRHTQSLDTDEARSLGPYRAAHDYRELGMYDEAIAEYRAVQERQGGLVPAGLGLTYAKMGRLEEARAVLREREQAAAPGGLSGTGNAQLCASLGQLDRALDLLERSFDDNPAAMLNLKTNVAYDPLRSEPRFQELVQRLGLSTD
jgi:tetratricopeptide (TPR) repeat protein